MMGAMYAIQQDIDAQNAAFWDTPCGTSSAIALGVAGRSCDDLKKFDDWFFRFYPYLNAYIRQTGVGGRSRIRQRRPKNSRSRRGLHRTRYRARAGQASKDGFPFFSSLSQSASLSASASGPPTLLTIVSSKRSLKSG